LRVYMERDMAELGRIASLPPHQLSAALRAWLETMHCDSDCPLLVTELQLHARRNPVFAKRYYALQDQQTRALARILERFFEAQSVPLPMDPRDLAGCMTALAHGLSLQHPQAKPGVRSTAGRVIGALLKLLAQR
jgi:BetI-type transcriptional repressor, C-terminal